VSDEIVIEDPEQVLNKEVTKTGNGAHVLVPKEWIGETVTVVKTED